MAEATADVVEVGADRVRSSTRNPCSAKHTPVVSPITPAPTTMTSGRRSPIPSAPLTASRLPSSALTAHFTTSSGKPKLQHLTGVRRRSAGATATVGSLPTSRDGALKDAIFPDGFDVTAEG